MNRTPPRTVKPTPQVRDKKGPPPIVHETDYVPTDPNLMETRTLMMFNPAPGKSWAEEQGKRVYYRKSRRANRRNRSSRRNRSTRR